MDDRILMRYKNVACPWLGASRRLKMNVSTGFNQLYMPFKLKRDIQYSPGFFHQPAYPRGEGATIKRISPPRKPPAGRGGGIAADPRRFRGGFYR